VERLHGALLAAFVLGLGTSISLAQSALAALTVLWLWRLRAPEVRARAIWPLAGPVLAFSVVSLISALASPAPVASLLASKGLLLVAALYVTADAARDGAAARRLLTGLALAGGIGAVVGLVQVGLCPGSGSTGGGPAWIYHRCDRARGLFSIYMTLGGVLMLMLLATLPRLLPGAERARWFPSAWLVMLAGLVATYVRGAWLGFAAGALAVAALARRGRWLIVGGLVALLGLGLLGPYELRQRLEKMADVQEAGVRERVYMWRSGVAMWAERPWLGVGPDGVRREYARFALAEAYKKRTSHVHSAPLQILVERGIAGFAAWLWLWVAFYARVWAILRALPPTGADRGLAIGCLGAVTGFLVSGLTEYNWGDAEVVMVLWVLMALPFALGGGRGAGASDAPTGASRGPSPTGP
jgi:O-antigen ligase